MGNFLGVYMSQDSGVVSAFDVLFDEVDDFSRIIELGTGFGGLSIFLGIYGAVKQCDIWTYDSNSISGCNYRQILGRLDVNVITADIFKIKKEICTLINSPGKTLLLCDNGNKKKEFNSCASALKHNDIIMAHDFGSEINLHDINKVCSKFNIQFHDLHALFVKFNWLCMVKQ